MKFVPIYSTLAAAGLVNGSTFLSKISKVGNDFHEHVLTPISEFANLYSGIGDDHSNEIPSIAETTDLGELLDQNDVVSEEDQEMEPTAISAALTDWEELDGPQWRAIFYDEETKHPIERDIAFRKALAIMGTLITRYPSIPGAELTELVEFPLFCSESNFAKIQNQN